jgi:hypothetical protein
MNKPLEEILKETDAEFFRLHPALKNRPLGAGSAEAANSEEAALRKEWTRLLLNRRGEVSDEDLRGVTGGVATSHILTAAQRVMRGA